MRLKLERILPILIASGILTMGPVHADSNEERWTQLDNLGITLSKQGDYQKAKSVWLTMLEKAQVRNPTNMELGIIYGNLACVEESLGHTESAIAWRNKLLAVLNSTSEDELRDISRALSCAAESLCQLKAYSHAEIWYKASMLVLDKTKDGSLSALTELAQCYQSAHEWSKAEETYKRVLEIGERDKSRGSNSYVCSAYAGLGALYCNEKHYGQAEQFLQRAFEMEKSNRITAVFSPECSVNKLVALLDKQKRFAESAHFSKERLERAKTEYLSNCKDPALAGYRKLLISQGHRDEAEEFAAFVARHNPDRLQAAVDIMDKNPKLAEQKLKALEMPSAKVYLAYLYFTRKIPINNRSIRVDKLMNDAIADSRSVSNLGAIESGKTYHYTDMYMLLQHMRFITEVDPSTAYVPESIFKEYPAEAFHGFGAYFGSTLDGFLFVKIKDKEDIRKIPVISKFEKLIDQMHGDPPPGSQGTIANAWWRDETISFMKASIGPAAFLVTKGDGAPKVDPNLKQYLEVWSNQELWNKVKYREWLGATRDAEAALAKHYIRNFHLLPTKARLCASRAIAEINTSYLGEYPSSLIDEAKASPIYRTFSQSKLSLAQVQQKIGNRTFTKEELQEALRLAILNDDSADAIDWLVQKGAALTGDREPALFMAVLHPDVVDVLLKRGAEVNEANQFGKTALFQAVQFNSLGSVKILLDAGAQIAHKMKPVEEKKEDVFADPEYNYKVGGRTPLMYATSFAGYEVIQYLLDHGADRKLADSSGATAEKYLASNKIVSATERETLARELRVK